jgi:hypothetical protein
LKNLILIISLFNILFSTGFSQIENNNNAVIFYKQGIGVNVTMELTLSKDMTFIEYTQALSCVDRSMATNTISGTFTINKNKLKLTPSKEIYFDFKGNCTKTEGTDAITKSCSYITEYKIIKYKDLTLLLYDNNSSLNNMNDFIDIANAINKKDSEAEIRYIWKNTDNSIMVGKDISSSFPPPWNDYILSKPLIGKVITAKQVIKEDKAQYKYLDPGSKYIYTLDIGKEAGIRDRMLLYAKGKNSCLCEFIVLAVEDKQCRGFIRQYQEEDCKKNMEYSTKE